MAAMASTAATALGTMHGSCRPSTVTLSFWQVFRLMVSCSFPMDGVALNTVLKTTSAPSDIPPTMPPMWLVLVTTLPPSII